MPTESSSPGSDDLVTEPADDELTFAVHHLGRQRAPGPAAAELGFIPTRPVVSPPTTQPPAIPVSRPATLPPSTSGDGFVIRDADGVAPAAPVDALVVGAPEPLAPADPHEASSAPHERFRLNAFTGPASPPSPAQLWTTRYPSPQPEPEASAAPSRRGWSKRHSEVVDRSAHATMLRLREEAVNVSWKSAWIAVTSCDPGLLRRRSRQSS